MPHQSHKMDAYRDNGFEWVAFCKICSAETDDKLNVECPGQYVRSEIDKEHKSD